MGKIRGPYRTAKFSHRKKLIREFFITQKFLDLRYIQAFKNPEKVHVSVTLEPADTMCLGPYGGLYLVST